ncbi:MAG: hypothetical protein NVS3B9_2500 [Candidatus Doudnabacteria bacterium]
MHKPHLSKKALSLWQKILSKLDDSHKIIPFTPDHQKQKGKGFHYKGKEFVHHSDLYHEEVAFKTLSASQKIIISSAVLTLILLLVLNWRSTLLVIVVTLTIFYFSDLLFNFFLIYRTFTETPEIEISNQAVAELVDENLPTYTILCPLYKEAHILPQFVNAILNLDYPKDKLQVRLLLEEDDQETIIAARAARLPKCFEILIVPHSSPKTKPKACNYGLIGSEGKYCVIYDAEDVPEIDQLKKIVLAFKASSPDMVCMQAKLNFYNPHQNLLTKIFTAEYSLWFDLVLGGLQSIHAPIPLGGTSNHFNTQKLKELKGWDSFNVTEDCDLGIRLVKKGYRTAVVNSTTFEEANSSFTGWFGQRARWIKGYMQTYLVHMRRPGEFSNEFNKPHFLTFQLIVGGKILSMFINPLMWAITILYFLMRAKIGPFVDTFFPTIILYMAVICLIFGNFLYMYYYMIGCVKRGHFRIIKYSFLVPFYWLAMSVAGWIGLFGLMFNPHHWSKTKHGLHLNHPNIPGDIKFVKNL